MAYKRQYIEWDVPDTDLHPGEKIGYRIELSLNNPSIKPQLYEAYSYIPSLREPNQFYYSNDGEHWTEFPLDNEGIIFDEPYRVRVYFDSYQVGWIFAQKGGTIYRLTPNLSETVETFYVEDIEANSSNMVSFSADEETENLFLSGKDQTLYCIGSNPLLNSRSKNSINLQGDPLGIIVDGHRGSFWHIGSDGVYLKDLEGTSIRTYPLKIEIDFEQSSSSSSSSTSSSSLSSEGYTSSSSTSGSSSESEANTSSSSSSSPGI